jgi:protein-S-isoprenylcysteine O-methyltransferase
VRLSPVVALPYGPPLFYGSLLAMWILDQRRTSRPAREGEVERDEGTRFLIRRLGLAATVLAIGAAYAVPAATIPIDSTVALVAGIGVQWTGYLVVEWTTHVLGNLYRPVVAVQRDHRVVRSGPYRFVRHPMYAGALLSDVGIALALANALSFVLLLVPSTYAYVRRIAAEERLLSERLGEDYQEYARTTKRLIPFVW